MKTFFFALALCLAGFSAHAGQPVPVAKMAVSGADRMASTYTVLSDGTVEAQVWIQANDGGWMPVSGKFQRKVDKQDMQDITVESALLRGQNVQIKLPKQPCGPLKYTDYYTFNGREQYHVAAVYGCNTFTPQEQHLKNVALNLMGTFQSILEKLN
jgi:hypothetical protein